MTFFGLHRFSALILIAIFYTNGFIACSDESDTTDTQPTEEIIETTEDSLPDDTQLPEDTRQQEETEETENEPQSEVEDSSEPEITEDTDSDPDSVEDTSEPDNIEDSLEPEEVEEETSNDEVPLPGYGTISGDCGILDEEEWNSESTFIFFNTIDFGEISFDESLLTEGGLTLWEDGNLGGDSVHSEIIAFEVLYRCELAALLASEINIHYQDTGGKKTDILVSIDDFTIGVSVTRAFRYVPEQQWTPDSGEPRPPYEESAARSLLERKLGDLPLSQANASPEHAWIRSVLYVLAYDTQHAEMISSVFDTLPAELTQDAIIIVTVTDGTDDFVY